MTSQGGEREALRERSRYRLALTAILLDHGLTEVAHTAMKLAYTSTERKGTRGERKAKKKFDQLFRRSSNGNEGGEGLPS